MIKFFFSFLLTVSTLVAYSQNVPETPKDSIKTIVVTPIAERQDTVKVRALLDEPTLQVRTYYLITRKYVFAKNTGQPDQPYKMFLVDLLNPKHVVEDLQEKVIWMVKTTK